LTAPAAQLWLATLLLALRLLPLTQRLKCQQFFLLKSLWQAWTPQKQQQQQQQSRFWWLLLTVTALELIWQLCPSHHRRVLLWGMQQA
jgi:hypothetical protein